MRSRLSRTWLIAAAAGALIAPAILAPAVDAQKQGAPLWYSTATVTRKEKPNRERSHPISKTRKEKATLLTLQWHLVKRIDDDKQEEADPSQEFQTGDRLKLAITVNQTGYLYIVSQPEGKDAVLLFPDLRINKGQNSVVKDKDYVIPSFCAEYDDPKDCWYKMIPPAGTETLIVIFSRDKITNLPNNIAKPYPTVKREVVTRLIANSDQKVKQVTGDLAIPGQKATRYATRLQNTNLQDNEELIATIELRHSE